VIVSPSPNIGDTSPVPQRSTPFVVTLGYRLKASDSKRESVRVSCWRG